MQVIPFGCNTPHQKLCAVNINSSVLTVTLSSAEPSPSCKACSTPWLLLPAFPFCIKCNTYHIQRLTLSSRNMGSMTQVLSSLTLLKSSETAWRRGSIPQKPTAKISHFLKDIKGCQDSLACLLLTGRSKQPI